MRGARPELRVVDEQDANLHLENGHSAMTVSKKDSDAESFPPAELPEALAVTWRLIVGDLKDRRLWKDSMGGLVTSYVLAQATLLRLELRIAIEGESVTGAGGAAKPHPATGLLRSSRQTVERLGAELGLSPTARSRKSLQPQVEQSGLFDKWDL